ncbi:MAG: TIR domain-containing protein [Clostridia bacterium]|nr:TIR domain-containing protein [Clostridia bacterium]
MTEYRCKNCGGSCEISNTSRFIQCEYCGSTFELDANRAQFANLYSIADDAWSRKDFDKALDAYLQIAEKDNLQSEAHWGAALCRYGIAYEVDPVSGEKKPTCNRINRESIFEDKNYIAAIKHASPENKQKYSIRASEIDRISVEFLKIVENESPYDVFISYKRTDERGLKTIDAEYAMKLYLFLKSNGIRVFFAEETLKNIAGSLYEPYIFAALQSSKVMVLMGSSREYIESTWVKNEWQRFFKLMETKADKTLIPVFIGGDPYEILPQRFQPLQAFNAGSPAFVEEILENVKKKLTGPAQQSIPSGGNSAQSVTVDSLLERAFMLLSDGEFEKSSKQLEKVLDIDPKCAAAYLCALMVEHRVTEESQLSSLSHRIDLSSNYKKIIAFGNEGLKKRVSGYSDAILQRLGQAEMRRQELQQKKDDLKKKVDNADRSLGNLNDKRNQLTAKIAAEESNYANLKRKIDISRAQQVKYKNKFISPIWIVLIGLVLDACFIFNLCLRPHAPSTTVLLLTFILPATIVSFIALFSYFNFAGVIVPFIVFFITFAIVAAINGNGIITAVLGIFYDLTLGLLFNDKTVLTAENIKMTVVFGAQVLYIIAFIGGAASSIKRIKKKIQYIQLKKQIAADEKEYNEKSQKNTVLIQLRKELQKADEEYNELFASYKSELLRDNSEYVSFAHKSGLKPESVVPVKYLQ